MLILLAMNFSKETKTGIVVVVAIFIVIYGFNFLSGIDLFKKSNTIYAVYSKTDGLMEANPVLINGVKVGQVQKTNLMQYQGEYKVLVTMILSNKKLQIPKGSVAKLISSDLLGSKAIDIKILPNSNDFIHDEDTLKGDVEDDLKTSVDKRLTPLQKKAESLISSIDSVMQVVQAVLNENVRKNLIASFDNLHNSLISLQHASSSLDGIMSGEKATIAQILRKVESLASNLEKNNGKITNILSNFSTLSDSLAKANIKNTIEHANMAIAQANTMLENINSGKGTLGKLIKNDSIYNNLNRASDDLDKLLVDLKEHPKRYVSISVFGGKDKSKKKDKKNKVK
ncbi:MAG: MCE family protein [Bacteroidetes bacterium]|nr:MCE family protein [Bacteroidota bacterium]